MNKLSRLALALGMTLAINNAMAQQHRQCGNERLNKFLKTIPAQKQNVIPAVGSAAYSKGAGGIVTIPVVFHVVLNQTQLDQIGGAAGVLARCTSQIAALNADYGGLNADSTSIPAVFKSLYGKSGIRFGLAHTDPSNHSTPGYDVTVITSNGFDETTNLFGGEAKHSASGGVDAWDVSKYLNIWVINFLTGTSNSGTLGISISPGTVADYPFQFAPGDAGVMVGYGAFGVRSGNVSSTNYYVNLGGGHYADRGRTLTHEVGHFFEMQHIWGNDGGLCPGQSGYEDDGISDTPPSADENYGCPTFPHVTCTASATTGDMFMNYMDYSDDMCLLMFTKKQADSMYTHLTVNHESYSLTQYPALLQYPLGVPSVNSSPAFTISPNPSSGSLTIAFSQKPEALRAIGITNPLGQIVHIISSGNQDIYHIDLSILAKGVYFVQCQFSTGMVTEKIVLQ